MRYDYDMLSNLIHQASMEAGQRWMLNGVAGKPIHTWDSRGHMFCIEYDELRRPIKSFVIGADLTNLGRRILFERIIYGEQHPVTSSVTCAGECGYISTRLALSPTDSMTLRVICWAEPAV
jgi:hypothetical protein